MRPPRRLALRRESLTELACADLAAVAAAGSGPCVVHYIKAAVDAVVERTDVPSVCYCP